MKSLGIVNFPLGGHAWRVHSLGAIRRNGQDTNNQTIEVFLSPPPHLARTGYFFHTFAPIALLPILRIGSTWRDGWCEPEDSTCLGRKLLLAVDSGVGRIVQAEEHADFFGRCWPLPDDIKARGYFVQTTGRYRLNGQWEGCTVIVPCLVVLGHFYAGTSNLATLLCRHLPGKQWERIYYLENQQTKRGTEIRSYYDQARRRVHVCLAACIEDAGYPYVAWFFREAQARSEAMAIPYRLSVASGDQLLGRHLKIGLPFTSEAKLECYGLWDEQTQTVLVHRVTRCGYQMTGTRVVTFDRENDSTPESHLPPGARYEDLPLSSPAPPRKEAATTPPEGGKVTLDPPCGNQQSLTFEVINPMELFGFKGGKVRKMYRRTRGATPTPPMPDDEVYELLGCGEKAYTIEAKPGLAVQPPDPPSADATLQSEEVLSQVPEDGFRYIREVLKMLLLEGWHLTYVINRRLVFDFDSKFNLKATPKLPTDAEALRKLPQGKVLVIKLVHGQTRFILIEFALLSTSTATVLVWPRDIAHAPPPRDLLNLVLSGGIWKEIKPKLHPQGWNAVAVKHQALRPAGEQQVAPADRTYTFTESVEHHAEKLLEHLSKQDS